LSSEYPAACGGDPLFTPEVDPAVYNQETFKVFENLKNQGVNLKIESFSKSENIPHDSIDPRNKDGKIDIVYPKILEWIGE